MPTVSRLTFFRWLAAIVAIACTVVFVPWSIVWAYVRPLPDTVQQEVDAAVTQGLDGIVVYAQQGDDAGVLYAAGWQDKARRVPADPEALFKIGSISKLYIAAATAMLVAEGRLSLDATLADHFPDLASRLPNAERITVRMLLQHTSGLPDWIEDAEFPWHTSLSDVDAYLALVLDEAAEFSPGSRYDYSNTNYLLIGRLLDQTLGYPHQRFIEARILSPLGLSHTFGELGDVDAELVFSGYFTGDDTDLKPLDIVVPGGSMIATARDTGVFVRALNNGSLLAGDAGRIYGEIYRYDHTGLWPGYSSIARYHKDMDTVVIQFVNTSGGYSWEISEIVYNRIVRILKTKATF